MKKGDIISMGDRTFTITGMEDFDDPVVVSDAMQYSDIMVINGSLYYIREVKP